MYHASIDSTALVVLTNLAWYIFETNPADDLYPGKLGARQNVKFACELAEQALARIGYEIPERKTS